MIKKATNLLIMFVNLRTVSGISRWVVDVQVRNSHGAKGTDGIVSQIEWRNDAFHMLDFGQLHFQTFSLLQKVALKNTLVIFQSDQDKVNVCVKLILEGVVELQLRIIRRKKMLEFIVETKPAYLE